MDLVWSAEMASKSFTETVESCPKIKKLGLPEMLSGVAAGWNSKLIVEFSLDSDPIELSVGLAIAAGNTGGKHVCIVPDRLSKFVFVGCLEGILGVSSSPATKAVVGEAEKVVSQFEGIDFLALDCTRENFSRVLRAAKMRPQGAIIACIKNPNERNMTSVIEDITGMHVHRSMSHLIGWTKGLDILYVHSINRAAPAPEPEPDSAPTPAPAPAPAPAPPLLFKVKHQRSNEEHTIRVWFMIHSFQQL